MPDPISAADKLKAIKREISQRKFVYPKLVASGKMTQAKANHEIAVMESIYIDYEPQAEKERLI